MGSTYSSYSAFGSPSSGTSIYLVSNASASFNSFPSLSNYLTLPSLPIIFLIPSLNCLTATCFLPTSFFRTFFSPVMGSNYSSYCAFGSASLSISIIFSSNASASFNSFPSLSNYLTLPSLPITCLIPSLRVLTTICFLAGLLGSFLRTFFSPVMGSTYSSYCAFGSPSLSTSIIFSSKASFSLISFPSLSNYFIFPSLPKTALIPSFITFIIACFLPPGIIPAGLFTFFLRTTVFPVTGS